MIRLALCGALCFCTLMTSLELYRLKLRDADYIKELSEVAARAVSLLRFEALDVYGVCARAFEGVELIDPKEFKSITEGDFPKMWRSACESLETDPQAAKIFASIGSVLGSCDIESQTERLELIKSELYERQRAARQKAESEKKLYAALGAFSGIGISIMII